MKSDEPVPSYPAPRWSVTSSAPGTPHLATAQRANKDTAPPSQITPKEVWSELVARVALTTFFAMWSSTLSHEVIPAGDKLKLWTVFRNVGVEGEGILKTAKLVHVHDKEGFVVTNMDEMYHFSQELGDMKIIAI
ncbi:hypothetical protein Fcan01_26750 [Folsomia candida]|uniref:Uncharacterized protein n=1 Tax=Folsomia candida TaxID=158441 RepID=A0A226D179_FOLCA|nr:hypothetical protein Fcan01_26750 [Folsomia candida]